MMHGDDDQIVPIGASAMLSLLVGYVALQEPLTGVRALAIVLIAAGIFVLQVQGG